MVVILQILTIDPRLSIESLNFRIHNTRIRAFGEITRIGIESDREKERERERGRTKGRDRPKRD